MLSRDCLEDLADLRKNAPRTMKQIKALTIAEYEALPEEKKGGSKRTQKLVRTAIICRHQRKAVSYLRDMEGVVSKRAIYDTLSVLNEANLLRHTMKLSRNAVVADSGVQARRERIQNNKEQLLV